MANVKDPYASKAEATATQIENDNIARTVAKQNAQGASQGALSGFTGQHASSNTNYNPNPTDGRNDASLENQQQIDALHRQLAELDTLNLTPEEYAQRRGTLQSELGKVQMRNATPQQQNANANKNNNKKTTTQIDPTEAEFNTRLQKLNDLTNDAYDNQLTAQQQALKTALDQSVEAQEASRTGINNAFTQSANDLAVQYERNRRNANEYAMARGLNTGTGSQQQLAMGMNYNTNFGRLSGEKAQQLAEVDRQIANLKTNYQNQLAQALADNEFEKAKQLQANYQNAQSWYDNERTRIQNREWQLADTESNREFQEKMTAADREYNDKIRAEQRADTKEQQEYQQQLEQAKISASYGDFSAFEKLYGKKTAKIMKETWIMQNPRVAWATGQISAKEYKKLTGEDPPTAENNNGGGIPEPAYWDNGRPVYTKTDDTNTR